MGGWLNGDGWKFETVFTVGPGRGFYDIGVDRGFRRAPAASGES